MSIDGFLNVYRAYIQPIIAILGLAGNILVILVFCKKRVSRFNIYSISLLVGHSLALIINSFLDDFLGRGLYYATSGRSYVKIDIISKLSCGLMEYMATAMYFGSGFVMVTFTIDRFLVLTWPFKFKGDNGILKSMIICALVYGFGFLTGIPLAISHKLVATPGKWSIQNMSCEINTNNSRLASMSLYFESIVVFVVPTVIVLLFNIGIIYQIIKVTKIRSNIVVNKKMNQLEMSRIVGMLAVTSSFLLFTIPLSVVIIIRLQNAKVRPKNMRALSKLFDSLKDINYSINFLIYYTFLSYFKSDLKNLFTSSAIYQFLSSSKAPDIEMDDKFEEMG